MAWIFLLTAGFFEVVATTVYRYSDGLTRNRSVSTIPIGMAYAVWTGIGAAGTAALGMVTYGESATAVRIAHLA